MKQNIPYLILNFLSLGLLYVIETQKVLDLKLNLMASYVIIPQTGFYDGTQNIMLLDLGHFKVRRYHNPKVDWMLLKEYIWTFSSLAFRCPVRVRRIFHSCQWVTATLKTSCPEHTTGLTFSSAACSSFTANQVHIHLFRGYHFIYFFYVFLHKVSAIESLF